MSTIVRWPYGVEARNLDQVTEFLRQDTAVFLDSVQTIKLLVAEENVVAAWDHV